MDKKLQELVSRGDVIDLQNFAISKKRDGDLETSKIAYKEALKIDLFNFDSYYGLGKIFYLMREREESIRNYLIAVHLSIQIQKRMYLSEKERNMIEALITNISQETRDAVSQISPDAVFLLLDSNTPRHLGHAVFDWGTGLPSVLGLNEHIQVYASFLRGKPVGVLDENLEMAFYLGLGKYFLFENLQWNQINIANPIELYQYDMFSYNYATAFFQKAFRTDMIID
ncbi:MAG: hypothetical protein HC820_07410 [Hydrococcus sp. RM1_1_31]|nr:hypothetical protein [Hydrococcus sp. RM1_1_31]